MIKNQLIGILTVIFIIISVLLNIFDIAYISGNNIFGYSFIILGSSLTYTAFIQNKKTIVFIGSATFLSGVLLIILDNFEIYIRLDFVLPIILLVAGCSLLTTYLTDFAKRILLLLSLIFLAAGFTLLIFQKSFDFEIYFRSVLSIISVYWPIILIMIFVII
ncbi:MAG: hypothetical protein DRQ01_00900, partial [Ignavibacteriae bacterium]